MIRNSSRGSILVQTIVFSSVAALVIASLVGWAVSSTRFARESTYREQAFHIAEAGLEYYRWHLAHAPSDFQDGTGQSGPYLHTYTDKNGVEVGEFSLDITAPSGGSSLVVVRSTGTVTEYPDISRTVEAVLAIPSLASYAIIGNADLRFGAGTEVFGAVHSNGGIRFDGLAHNIVSSARSTYTDPDSPYGTRHAVQTYLSLADPAPPTALPSRPDVFAAGRSVSVPTVDFTGITADMAVMKAEAQSGGRYLPASGGLGYHVVLQATGMMDIYRVNGLTAAPSGCTAPTGQAGWGTWSINTQTLIGSYAIPENGVLFLEDNVWVDGVLNGRLTIAAGRFPDDATNRPSITVNQDITYAAYDGSSALALVAQRDINVGLVSDTDLRIDAALIAQNGRVGRYYYSSSCAPYSARGSITLFGSMMTANRYGFAYTDATGYQTRTLNFDASFIYAPPPFFPLSSDQYSVISWREVK
ncbi:hypothetical protein K8Q93_00805 [Candidatus Parcubacteria bacterium]|nr:hypothetical protein [Candidatus Parcubacteria bacterium]